VCVYCDDVCVYCDDVCVYCDDVWLTHIHMTLCVSYTYDSMRVGDVRMYVVCDIRIIVCVCVCVYACVCVFECVCVRQKWL